MHNFFPALFGLLFCQTVLAASRTSPPSGAVVVQAGTKYTTVSSAIAALPDDGSAQTIFIYPGTYNEQVYITRTGALTIYGYTSNTASYASNQVVITAGVPASTAGSDDASGTVRIHTNNFKMYNVNVYNTYGAGSQAIALSQYGSQVGLYACQFYGYQDTLYANTGTQVYLNNYIEGAIDFIFGREGQAYFGGNTIGVVAPGTITANGRTSDDDGSYVFESNTIVYASGSASDTAGNFYLGRPWGDYAKVIFKDTVMDAEINSALWSVWETDDPNTSDVFLADYDTTGSGIVNPDRPSWATLLTSSEAAEYDISSAVGSDYASWVDASYL